MMVHGLGNGSHIGTTRPFESKRKRGQFRRLYPSKRKHPAGTIANVESIMNEQRRS